MSSPATPQQACLPVPSAGADSELPQSVLPVLPVGLSASVETGVWFRRQSPFLSREVYLGL